MISTPTTGNSTNLPILARNHSYQNIARRPTIPGTIFPGATGFYSPLVPTKASTHSIPVDFTAPFYRIDRLAISADTEIQSCAASAAAFADGGNDIAWSYRIAD